MKPTEPVYETQRLASAESPSDPWVMAAAIVLIIISLVIGLTGCGAGLRIGACAMPAVEHEGMRLTACGMTMSEDGLTWCRYDGMWWVRKCSVIVGANGRGSWELIRRDCEAESKPKPAPDTRITGDAAEMACLN